MEDEVLLDKHSERVVELAWWKSDMWEEGRKRESTETKEDVEDTL